MTALTLLLEDFALPASGAGPGGPADSSPGPDALEEARLAGFEAGFRAGWDDATAALGDSDAEARASALAKLQEISFSYHEARAQLLSRIAPTLEAMLARLLPDLVRQTLGPAVLEALMSPLHAASAQPPALHLHPDSLRAVQAFLAEADAPALALQADPDLGLGEAVLVPADASQDATMIEGEAMVAAVLAQLRDALSASPDPAAASAAPTAPPPTQRAANG